MTVQETLQTVFSYPFPGDFIEAIGDEVGLDLMANIDEADKIPLYRAKARIYLFLSTAPNVSEGGVSISYTAADKENFLNLARMYANLAGETDLLVGQQYGYMGQKL